MTKPYAEDLAYIHDVGYGGFATDAAPALLDIFRRGGITSGHVVDLGCGSGLWAAELCRAGYDVLGIDISPSMLSIARAQAPRAKFRRGSFLTAKLPPCDAVTALGECFSYRFDAKADLQQLGALFRRIHRVLRSGGIFVFDILELPRRPSMPTEQRHATGRDWAVLLRVAYNVPRGELTRYITSFRKVGRLYRRAEEVHHLRLYRRSEIIASLRCVGFRVRTVRGYGDRRFVEGQVGFVASKR